MSAEVVQLRIFHPRIPRDTDTELSIQADLVMLDKIGQWVASQKQLCSHDSKPLTPAVRRMVMDASDALEL